MLCVADRILFMLEWTYLKPTVTNGSIFRKEADTSIETTFSGCNEGYMSCDDDLLDLSSISLSASPSSLLSFALEQSKVFLEKQTFKYFRFHAVISNHFRTKFLKKTDFLSHFLFHTVMWNHFRTKILQKNLTF